MPAAVGGAVWSARLQRKAALREAPRPGSRAVRGMPMMQRLYLAAGMPAAASRSIRPQMLSISRCRWGSLPSRMLGLSAASIGRDEINRLCVRPRRKTSRMRDPACPGDRVDFGHGLLLLEAGKVRHGFDIPD